MKISKGTDWTEQIVYLLIIIYAITLSILSIMRYSSYHAAIYDLGIMVQAIWNTSHGRLFYESVNLGYPISRFWTAHWEFIYLLIAPFYAIFQSPKFLLILQSLLIGIGALPIYLIGRKILKNKALAVAIASSYLLNPAVQNSNLFDFHGTTLATSLILFGFYFFIEKKWELFWGLFILALLCREDVSLIWLFFGLYIILFSTHKKSGFSLSFIGALWFILFMNRLYLRNFLGLPPIQWTVDLPSHWSNLSGGGIKDLLISIIAHPVYVLRYLFSGQNLVYYVKLFFPALFLSFAAPEILLIAFPIFFINVMSNYSFTHDIKSQYTALLTPFIYISMIYGLNRILSFIQRKLTTRLRFIHYLVLIGIVGAAGMSFFLQSQAFQANHWLKTDHDRILDKMLPKIPDEASVSTTNLIGAHVANRYKLYAFPNRFKEADYVVYDFYAPFEYLYSDTSFQMPIVPPINQMSKKLLNDKELGVISFQDGITLFQKNMDYQEGIKKFLFVKDKSEIKRKYNIQIADAHLIFKGYTFVGKAGKWLKQFHFTYYWEINDRLPENTTLYIKVMNQKNAVVGVPHHPLFSSDWESGKIIRDPILISIPRGMQDKILSFWLAVSEPTGKGTTEYKHLYDFQINSARE